MLTSQFCFMIKFWSNNELLFFLQIVSAIPKNEKLTGSLKGPHAPTCLWNSMIHPMLNFTIKGAIWYQGRWYKPWGWARKLLSISWEDSSFRVHSSENFLWKEAFVFYALAFIIVVVILDWGLKVSNSIFLQIDLLKSQLFSQWLNFLFPNLCMTAIARYC